VYTDSPQPYHGGDPVRDNATALQAVQDLANDLTGGANMVYSGFTLSVVSGMQVQVAAGFCRANGLRAATVLTTLTINTTSTQPRYTIIRVTVTPNNPNGTDPVTGNNLVADTNALGSGIAISNQKFLDPFSPLAGTITVTTGRDGAWAAIAVADSGPGIQAADQDRIFERFYRAPRETNDPITRGSGLGLAIVKAITAQHGGTITVDSEPGRGATFVVRLPLAGRPIDPDGQPVTGAVPLDWMGTR